MKRLASIAIGVSASVLALGTMAAVAGPIMYGSAAASPSATIPSVMPTVRAVSPQSVVNDTSDLSGDWAIENGSSAGYTVGAVVNGSAVTVSGTTDRVAGSATVEDSVLTGATIVVEVASITTDNAVRDAYFRGPALDAADYPTALFTLSSPITLTDDLLGGKPVTVAASGDLNLHGVSRAVEVSLTATLKNGRLTLTGSVPVSFDDYGIEPIDLGFARVDNEGSIDFILAVSPR
ncbi:YceI family protein [Agreia sp. VKM Ac-1783]|uniref:YceI family protein n=1 Tax=Agreia sp. VKM Ac-1783 TaxID=1938889 RepID=UPI000A2AC357|nr:YceI family protein [Agreia sp. VKM Ac-1783]SMQ68117.1 Polyisoprenoid-binding protein YceI [Agreia sp. VKM Ac-1783]